MDLPKDFQKIQISIDLPMDFQKIQLSIDLPMNFKGKSISDGFTNESYHNIIKVQSENFHACHNRNRNRTLNQK